MKKIFFIFFSFILLITSAYGQNYQTVNPNRVAIFANQSNTVKCIRIDSIAVETDTLLFPFRNIQKIDYECFTPYGASWIGQKIVFESDSIEYFYNLNNQKIIIKKNAILNENWIAFYIEDSLTIIATVIKHDTLSFLGLTDSVKTISLMVFNKNMVQTNDQLNSMQIQLSKNYGCVKILNFCSFPNITSGLFSESIEEYRLIGLSDPKVGVQNLTWFDVNDFQKNDEIHVLYHSANGGNVLTNKIIYTILQRTDYTDSIVYILSFQKRSIREENGKTTSNSYKHDTVSMVIKPDLKFDKLPGEVIIANKEAYNYSMINDEMLSKKEPPDLYHILQIYSDTCWIIPTGHGCFAFKTYLKGLGGPYYKCDVSIESSEERTLVYYKKGNDTWGTPLDLSKVTEYKNTKTIEIFPNPTNEYISIYLQNIESQVTFELIAIHGRIILTKTINTNQENIFVNDLKAGMYFYRIKNEKSILQTGKVIIE